MQYLTHKNTTLRLLITAATILLANTSAYAATPNPCAIKAADISRILGIPFNEGKLGDSPLGAECTYKSKAKLAALGTDIDVWVGMLPMQGTFESMKFMLGPPSQKYSPVPKDNDKAMTIIHAPDVPSFPEIAYIRSGQLVKIHIGSGIYPSDKAERKALVDKLNQKLLTLPRIP